MNYPIVITIASEKGGVGKTTVATNLAVYLKALREDIPVTIFSFDNHFTVDKMLSIGGITPETSVRDIFRGRDLSELVQTGQYGVNFIASQNKLASFGERHEILSSQIADSSLDGIIIIDTRPSMDFSTKSALIASDLVIIPIKDLPSLDNIGGITSFCEDESDHPVNIRLLPSIVDGTVKFKSGKSATMDCLLRTVAAKRGYELIKHSIPRSPKVETLTTNSFSKVFPVITHARETGVHKSFTLLARDILSIIDKISEPQSLMALRKNIFASDAESNERYKERVATISPLCPSCGSKILTGLKNIKRDVLYFKSGRGKNGFVDKTCFTKDILDELVRLDKDLIYFRDELTEEIEGDNVFCIRIVDGEIQFSLYDTEGKTIFEGRARYSAGSPFAKLLHAMMTKTSEGFNPCIIKFGGKPFPDTILLDDSYYDFISLKNKITGEQEETGYKTRKKRLFKLPFS